MLRIAHREGLPVITRGAGTNLSGATIPLTGGIVLALTRMNRILEVDHLNGCAVVEPGVVNGEFQAQVESEGLFYPPDPSSMAQSTLGGNVACCAGGPHCLKYGVTKDYVLGLTVVLADGRVMQLGGKLYKNVTGYNLSQLIIGAEGTLGVVTRIILRLLPLPRVRRAGGCLFPNPCRSHRRRSRRDGRGHPARHSGDHGPADDPRGGGVSAHWVGHGGRGAVAH